MLFSNGKCGGWGVACKITRPTTRILIYFDIIENKYILRGTFRRVPRVCSFDAITTTVCRRFLTSPPPSNRQTAEGKKNEDVCGFTRVADGIQCRSCIYTCIY